MATPDPHEPLVDRPTVDGGGERVHDPSESVDTDTFGQDPQDPQDPSVGAAEDEVRRSRRELLDSVEALADRLDIKNRTRHRFEETKQRVADGARRLREQPADAFTHPDDSNKKLGEPTTSGWIAIALVASATVIVLTVAIRAARR